jgi:hypothetical protein
MKHPFLSALLAAVLLGACGGGTGSDEQPEAVNTGTTPEAADRLYQMPTPNELFSLVRDMAGDGHRRMLNPANNVDRYASKRARGLNFGIYATDLVYASYFKLNVEVARYYLASKKLAEGLGIGGAFTEGDFVRLETNLTRGDSLEVISNAAYQRAYEKLQDEQMGPTLALVLAGGWVESMHLVVRQIEAFGSNPVLMARVAEQKVTLEHLLVLMEPYADDADVAPVHRELSGVREIYDAVDVQRVPHEGRSASGRMVLGEDVKMDLTDEKYRKLVEAVDRLRAAWVRPEDAPNA